MIVSSVINTGATIAIASVIKTTNSLDLFLLLLSTHTCSHLDIYLLIRLFIHLFIYFCFFFFRARFSKLLLTPQGRGWVFP